MQSKPLVLIVGPTAVGKTEIAIEIAARLSGEIISADSRLFYRGMDIGTAKPSGPDLQRVPHHLIDIADPWETLNLAEFQSLARKAIGEVHLRGNLPFLVGGTGQYIRAVTQGWNPPAVKPNHPLRNVLKDLAERRSNYWLYEKLNILDPSAAGEIDPRNVRRTIRALEVIFVTGRKFSDLRGYRDSPYQGITLGLTRSREELYARVDSRIDVMFAVGLEDEVRRLLSSGCTENMPSMSAIGYRECAKVIRGEWTSEQAKMEMRRATRKFIRRQANWFKPADPQIFWFNAGRPETVKEIVNFIRNSLPPGVL